MESGAGFGDRRVFDGVVLDANVLYSISLRDTLLRAAERDLFVPLWSALILEEVRRNLVKGGREHDKILRMIAAMRRRFPRAEQVVSEELIAQMTNAIEDRHILAVAVATHAAIIVTSNLRDFPAPSVRPYGVVALSPDDFLCLLLDARSEEMAQVIREQSADLVQRPLTVEEVLARLSRQAPMFSARTRVVLG